MNVPDSCWPPHTCALQAGDSRAALAQIHLEPAGRRALVFKAGQYADIQLNMDPDVLNSTLLRPFALQQVRGAGYRGGVLGRRLQGRCA
jgi:hypothetical protein